MLARDTDTHIHMHTLRTQGEGIYKLLCPHILTHIPLPPSSPLHRSVSPSSYPRKRGIPPLFTFGVNTNWKYLNHQLSPLIFFKPSHPDRPSPSSDLLCVLSLHLFIVNFLWISDFMNKKVQFICNKRKMQLLFCLSDGSYSHWAQLLHVFLSSLL